VGNSKAETKSQPGWRMRRHRLSQIVRDPSCVSQCRLSFLYYYLRFLRSTAINMLKRDMINAFHTHDLIGATCSNMKNSWGFDEVRLSVTAYYRVRMNLP
jgi:hypothetical protein